MPRKLHVADCSSKPNAYISFSVANYSLKLHKTTSIVHWIRQFHWALHHQIAMCTWACPTTPPPPPLPGSCLQSEKLLGGRRNSRRYVGTVHPRCVWTKTTQLTSPRAEVGLSSSRRFHHGYSQNFNPKQLSSCPQGSYKIVAGKVQSGYNHCRLHPSLVFLLTADHRSGQNRCACIDIYLCWYTWDHLPMFVHMYVVIRQEVHWPV